MCIFLLELWQNSVWRWGWCSMSMATNFSINERVSYNGFLWDAKLVGALLTLDENDHLCCHAHCSRLLREFSTCLPPCGWRCIDTVAKLCLKSTLNILMQRWLNFEYTHAKMTSLIMKNINEKKWFGVPHIHWNLSLMIRHHWNQNICPDYSEVFLFQEVNNVYLYKVGTQSSVLINEGSLIQRICPFRAVPLYSHSLILKSHVHL